MLTIPLINALRGRFPNLSITLTTTTPTGSTRAKEQFGADVAHVYMPYDLPWIVARFFNRVRPSCLIIMETEIWPHLINICDQRDIPVIIANARISDNSIGRYMWIRFFIKRILRKVTFVAAQSQLDAARFVQLGLSDDQILVTGNLKFDAQIDLEQYNLGQKMKLALTDRLVIVAASTHPGEEEQIVSAFVQIQQKIPNCVLILIPRHAHRFNEVATLLTNQGLKFVRRSEKRAFDQDVQVILGDSMGEMGMYYAMGDVAYVGGSLVPIGGHNLLEPSLAGLPSLTGPYMHNFKDITLLLQKAGALCVVNDATELAEELVLLLNSAELRAERGAIAQEVIGQNRGVLQKILNIIDQSHGLMLANR